MSAKKKKLNKCLDKGMKKTELINIYCILKTTTTTTQTYTKTKTTIVIATILQDIK